MATRLGKFELPNRLIKEEETATDKYAKFIADINILLIKT